MRSDSFPPVDEIACARSAVMSAADGDSCFFAMTLSGEDGSAQMSEGRP